MDKYPKTLSRLASSQPLQYNRSRVYQHLINHILKEYGYPDASW